MRKKCSKCLLEKDPIEFGVNKSKKDGLQTECKLCRSEYQKQWYNSNRALHYSRVERTIKERRLRLQQQMFDYFRSHPCVDCGESDPVVLECDHVGTKTDSISRMLAAKVSWVKIETELENCVVRCANCHKRKTARDQNWYKHLMNLDN